MIGAGHVVAVTLAAGLSRRFGGDKLSAPIMGTRVLDASMAPLDGFTFAGRAVVLNPARLERWDRADVAVIRNPAPERGMGHSLALAAQYAAEMKARFLLVTLGDMPRISHETIAALLRAGPDRGDALVAARPGDMPPARRRFSGTTGSRDSPGRRAIRARATCCAIPHTRSSPCRYRLRRRSISIPPRISPPPTPDGRKVKPFRR
ncbi:NTP transferase domain-containing protein [Croceicoccus sp. YJ47]|uniref:nucleotidyltransferase family protein n=1 Tax=Croceicoccus sp. YJ47 TaxID=2798724 RepID=UPI0019240092|nr:NTP transferase domain-containing protein [Croceicoccus sp. YJ47]QQN73321.1 NTP transferase domain-containing protein [Croceicoccus sp. YJ47]